MQTIMCILLILIVEKGNKKFTHTL